MIEAVFEYAEEGAALVSMSISGHAAAKHEDGYEVCVGASVLSQGMLKALDEMLPGLKYDYKKSSGKLSYRLRQKIEDKAQAAVYENVTRAFVISMKVLALEHPEFMKYSTM